MSQDLVENLLGNIPTGEVIKDAREGDQPDAKLTSPEIVDFGSGHAVKVVWTNLTDVNGRSFDMQQRIALPTSESPEWQHDKFLNLAWGLGIVPRAASKAINVDTDTDRQTVLNAFKSIEGKTFSITVYKNQKTGYLETRLARVRKAA